MIFNSLQFALFFPIVTILYFLLPHKHRWWLLLGASAYFYMAFIPSYILILGVTIVIDYFAGILIEKSSNRKKIYLMMSLIANIGLLALFKYFNFMNANVLILANLIGWNYPIQNLEIILPIGLSFHTFQAMSYTIEVFRGNQKTERHFGIFALYVLFFPQLVAGPIERPQNMLHQFHERHFFDYQRVADGLKLVTWGLFKKVVIADRLAPTVSFYYNNPQSASGPELAFATVFFAIQIYCDFSGYSDIAIGAAQILGFKFMVNFKRPYFALSISEFWTRWHISLSTWFRDYLYIPLGGNRVSKLRMQFNLMVVFLISGLWHGASWTYVIWGALHGLYMVTERNIKLIQQKYFQNKKYINQHVLNTLKRMIVLFLIGYAWIFFRAESIQDAFYIATHIFTGWFDASSYLAIRKEIGFQFLITNGLFILIMEIVHIFQERDSVLDWLSKQPIALKWTLYVSIITVILIFGKIYSEPTSFIYFQF